MGLFQFSSVGLCYTMIASSWAAFKHVFFIGVWDSCTCECLRFLLTEDHKESAEKMLRTEVEKLVSATFMTPKVKLTITAPDFTVKTSLEGPNINEQVNIRRGDVAWHTFCHPMVKGSMDMSARVSVSHPIDSLLGVAGDYLLYQMTTSWPFSTQPLEEASARAVIDLPAETWASIRGRGSRSIRYTHLCFTDIRANDVPARTTANF